MLDQTYNVPQQAGEILGDLTGLAQQLGSTDALSDLSLATASLAGARVASVADLERFLERYTSEVLVPHDLPGVSHAFAHATRGQLRELIALDKQLSQAPNLRGFANASSFVGRTQLRRLRPLRGERLVQRYLEAVESGEAAGWHTLVFGVVLGVYSLPLRQGLVHYAHQTLGGFVEAASHRFTVVNGDRERLLSYGQQPVASAVESVIAQSKFPQLVEG